jgi:ssDNA-binding Zn-finger/Zn-ribbon topoisomerase 1
MVEMADIFVRHGPDYRARFADRMPRSHLKAMRAIEQCRTEALGGKVFGCPDCGEWRYSYHSCRNRHCPKCQNGETTEWLEKLSHLLLPVPYFFTTFTLPEELRSIARKKQKTVYDLIFRASAEALKELALDPRHLGGSTGFMGIIHTWARDLAYHPHVHYIVPGGGLSPDGERWLPTRNPEFLVPEKPLAILFRAKVRDALKRAKLLAIVPSSVWRKDWVVNIKRVGTGETALKYLAPYVFRVAISNRRIESLENGRVTFRFKDSESGEWKRMSLDAEEFIRRFLQHVLPNRFVKVRYYGFMSQRNRDKLEKIRKLLGACREEQAFQESQVPDADCTSAASRYDESLVCPKCGGVMVLFRILEPKRSPS